MKDSLAYVIGLTRDISPYAALLEHNIRLLTSHFRDYRIVIYAGDASLSSLAEWKRRDEKLIVLPESAHKQQQQTATPSSSSLVYGRNKLRDTVVELHRNSSSSADSAYVVMLDLDDANKEEFNSTVFGEALQHSSEWDVLTFNRRNYYDIWALRYAHIDVNIWSFADDSRTLMGIVKRDIGRQLSNHKAQGKRFFPVYSAFAGVGVYKLSVLLGCDYHQRASEPYEPAKWLSRKGAEVIGPQGECEHVPFHACIRAKHAARIVISPEFLHTEKSLLLPSKGTQSGSLAEQALWVFGPVVSLSASGFGHPLQIVGPTLLSCLFVCAFAFGRRRPYPYSKRERSCVTREGMMSLLGTHQKIFNVHTR